MNDKPTVQPISAIYIFRQEACSINHQICAALVSNQVNTRYHLDISSKPQRMLEIAFIFASPHRVYSKEHLSWGTLSPAQLSSCSLRSFIQSGNSCCTARNPPPHTTIKWTLLWKMDSPARRALSSGKSLEQSSFSGDLWDVEM